MSRNQLQAYGTFTNDIYVHMTMHMYIVLQCIYTQTREDESKGACNLHNACKLHNWIAVHAECTLIILTIDAATSQENGLRLASFGRKLVDSLKTDMQSCKSSHSKVFFFNSHHLTCWDAVPSLGALGCNWSYHKENHLKCRCLQDIQVIHSYPIMICLKIFFENICHSCDAWAFLQPQTTRPFVLQGSLHHRIGDLAWTRGEKCNTSTKDALCKSNIKIIWLVLDVFFLSKSRKLD